jgi:NADP-dependent 3-hydroxy acid dehydrogenase YdfG
MRNPAYPATKAAVNPMSNQLAAELFARQIAVIALDPGVVGQRDHVGHLPT